LHSSLHLHLSFIFSFLHPTHPLNMSSAKVYVGTCAGSFDL
jgi:hypothetical protein